MNSTNKTIIAIFGIIVILLIIFFLTGYPAYVETVTN